MVFNLIEIAGMFDIKKYTINNNIIEVDLKDRIAIEKSLEYLIECVSDLETFSRFHIYDSDSRWKNYYFSFHFKDPHTGDFYALPEDDKRYGINQKHYVSNEAVFFASCVQYPDLRERLP